MAFDYSRSKARSISIDDLRRRLSYDPNTGVLTWLKSHKNIHVGKPAGLIDKYGYRVLTFNAITVFAHRVIWAMNYGGWPDAQVDHINCDRQDNRLSNLRLCDWNSNQWNRSSRKSTTGFKGVTRLASGNYKAYLRCNSVCYHLGVFSTPEEAARSYDAGALKHFGEFANLNFPVGETNG